MSHLKPNCHMSSGALSIFDGILLISIILVALIGNIITIVAFIKFRTLHTVTNFFIASLAAADILVSVLPMPMTFAVYVCSWLPKNQPQNKANNAYLICDIWSSSVSIYSLMTIAIDRFFAIKWPFAHQRIMTERVAAVIVVLCWMATLVIASMVIIVTDRRSFTLLIIIVSYAVPVSTMLLSYISIAIIANQQARKINALEVLNRTASCQQCNGTRRDSSSGSHAAIDSQSVDSKACGETIENSPIVLENSEKDKATSEINTIDRKIDDVQFVEHKITNEFYVNSKALRTSVENVENTEWSTVTRPSVTKSYQVATESMYQRSQVTVTENMHVKVSSSSMANPQRTARFSVAWRLNAVKFRRSLRREFKAAKTLALVMGSFIILWTPFMSINVIFYSSPNAHLNYNMVKYFKFLHYFNSALNPVLYILLNKQWRAAFRQLLCAWGSSRREIEQTARSEMLGW